MTVVLVLEVKVRPLPETRALRPSCFQHLVELAWQSWDAIGSAAFTFPDAPATPRYLSVDLSSFLCVVPCSPFSLWRWVKVACVGTTATMTTYQPFRPWLWHPRQLCVSLCCDLSAHILHLANSDRPPSTLEVLNLQEAKGK